MRAVVQRVSKAKVMVENEKIAEIGKGLVVLLGVECDDALEDAVYLAKKISKLRIFEDADGKMCEDVQQISGEVLSVSQFTLLAETKKGNRPNFSRAEKPTKAKEIYNFFNEQLSDMLDVDIQVGCFGADMQVELINDGPVTIIYDTNDGGKSI